MSEAATDDEDTIIVVHKESSEVNHNNNVSEQCDKLVLETSETLINILQDHHHQDSVGEIVDRFMVNLDTAVKNLLSQKNISLSRTPVSQPVIINNGAHFSDYSDTEPESPGVPKIKHNTTSNRPFFRRFSFKGITKSKALQFFHKQESDERELSTNSSQQASVQRLSGEKKQKLSKIVVECQKESLVNLIADVNMDGNTKWEKSKMMLVKSSGGFMLEFYSPPKTSRPKTGVFCFLITEARETTALEMPDKENTFVIKTENSQEYIIEAGDSEEMRSWLMSLHSCMRPRQ